MDTFVNVLLIVVGITVVAAAVDAAVRTFVVPRGSVVLITTIVFRALRRVFTLVMSPGHGYEALDRAWALYAPLSLLALPIVLLTIVFFGFACIFVGLEHHGWREAF